MKNTSLRLAGALAASLAAAPASAGMYTYHSDPLTLPAQAGDQYAFIGGLIAFDNGHVLAVRQDASGTGTTELYAVTDMTTPVVTVVDAQPAFSTFRRYSSLVGEYFYTRRWQGSTEIGLQRCRYTVACDPLNDAHWQTVAEPGKLSLFAQHSSDINMSGVAAFTTHGAIDGTSGLPVNSHRLVLANGTTFEFAQDPATSPDLNFLAKAPVAGEVNGKLVVIVPTAGGPVAHVFNSLQAGDSTAIPLGVAGQWAVDINGNGRLVIATPGATQADPVALNYCDLDVQFSAGTPILTCNQQSLGSHPFFQTGIQTFNRLNDNNQLVFHPGFGDDRLRIIDTDNLSAGTPTVVSRIVSGIAPPDGPFRGGTATDGRIIGLPSANNDSLSHDFFLLTPPNGSGGGGGGGGPITVAVDVKPGSCTNGFNADSRGVLPIAIVGTATQNAADIDPASVRLATLPALRWSLTDVATPGNCAASSADGYTDLLLMFDSRVLGDLADGLPDGVTVSAPFSGTLFGGQPFTGSADVKIINKH